MKKPTHRLTWGLAFLLVASLPRTSDAGSVYGTWQGMMTSTYEEFVNGVESGPYTNVYADTLTLQWTGSASGGTVDISISAYVPFEGIYISPDPFGPESAGFSYVVQSQMDFNTAELNFFATYSYIDSDGNIVGGSATADASFVGVLDQDPFNYTTISVFNSFQGSIAVPEPSTIVLMGLGLPISLIFARRLGLPIRASRVRPRRAEYR